MFSICFKLFFALLFSSVSSDWSTRIVGGQKARPSEFPSMASLQYRGQHFCAANVISSDWLITAAHCVDSSAYQNFTVVMATNDLRQTEGARVRYPERVLVHEKWDSKRLVNDIALIKLNASVEFDQRLQRALMPTKGWAVSEGEECLAVGWGRTSSNGALSPQLLKVTLPLTSQRTCQRAYQTEVTISEGHVCAGGQKGKGICSGDSGGALFCPERKGGARLVIVGVDSFTAICALQNFPSVFTKVSNYFQWISDKTGNDLNSGLI